MFADNPDSGEVLTLSTTTNPVGLELAITQFMNWIMSVPIDGPMTFTAVTGPFDQAFHNWRSEPMTFDERQAAEDAGVTVPCHRVEVRLTDVFHEHEVTMFWGVSAPCDENGVGVVRSLSDNDARHAIVEALLHLLAEVQARAVTEHFAVWPIADGVTFDEFTDCADRVGLDMSEADLLAERKWISGEVAFRCLGASFNLPDDGSADEVLALVTMANDILTADVDTVIAQVIARGRS